MVLGWALAILFICLYFDSKSKISYLNDRINSINIKYNQLLSEKESMQNPMTTQENSIENVMEEKPIPPPTSYASSSLYTKEQLEELAKERALKDSEQKNSAILTTGALLIVIAAIVFLTSTWSIVSSPIKIGVLLLLLLVFLQASKIAKNTLNLPKASNAFFYIAMAYLPICLCSISFLGLLGDYFSVHGPGKFIYFTLSSALIGGVYYYNYKNTNSTKLYIGSLICGLGSVILLSLIFSNSITLIISLVLIYNIIQLLMFRILGKDINKIHETFLNVTSYACFATYLVFVIGQHPEWYKSYEWGSFFDRIHPYNDLALPMLIIIPIMGAINALLQYTTNKEDIYITPYYLFTYIIPLVSFFELAKLNLSVPILVALMELILIIIKALNAFVFGYIKSERDNLGLIDYIIFSGSNVILYGYILTTMSSGFMCSMLLCAVAIIILITLCIMKKIYDINSANLLMPIMFSVATFNLLNAFILNYSDLVRINCYGIYAILILLLGILCIKKLKDKGFGNTFLAIAGICAFAASFHGLVVNAFDTKLMLIPSLIISTGIIGYIYYTHRNLGFLRGFLYFLIFYILVFTFGLIPEVTRNSQYATSGLIIGYGIAIYSLYKKEITFDIVFSLFATLCAIGHIDNTYVSYLVAIIWELAYLFSSKEESIQNLFKGILYLNTYSLYVTILNDLNMQSYMYLYIIGLYILGILFSKTIFNKYENNEYIILGILYLVSLFLYRDSLIDGIICVTFMVGTMIFSYIKGYGALFVCTMIAIIVNVLLLTRTAWFSMPWWIYLLVVGIILITFAMKNEKDEQKQRFEIKESIKNLKEMIDNK